MQNKLLTIAIFIFLAVAKHASSQQSAIDSMELKLKTALPDSTRAKTMINLGLAYENVSQAKARELYRQVREFSASKKMYFEEGVGYRYDATVLIYYLGDQQNGRKYLDSALISFGKATTVDARAQEALVYGDFSSLYRNLNNDTLAISYSLRSIQLLEKIERKNNLSVAYINLSNIYRDLGEEEKQMEAAKKSLQYAKEVNRPAQIFRAYAFIAHALNAAGDTATSKLYIDSSDVYFRTNIDFPTLYSYYLIKAATFKYQLRYDSALKYYSIAKDLAKQHNSSRNEIEPLSKIGLINIELKKYAAAETILNEALTAAIRDSVVLFQQDIYSSLSKLYQETGRYQQSLEAYKNYVVMKDSLGSQDRRKYIARLETSFDTERKESQIKQLEADKKVQELSVRQKSTWNYILIGSVIIILVFAALSWRNYQQKQKIQQQRIAELEKEKQLTAAEAVLKGEAQERNRLAKDLHDGLGGMLSGIKFAFQNMKGQFVMTPENHQAFERGIDMLDSSIKEMRRVAHNMMPEALVKFGLDTALRDFCNDINQSGVLKVNYQSIGLDNMEISQTTAITIYRMVQELINNVIKHAGASTAIVQLTRNGDQMAITVEDDGKGFDVSILNSSKGIGWDNIQNRIRFLKAKLDIRSTAGKGTSVMIEIPDSAKNEK